MGGPFIIFVFVFLDDHTGFVNKTMKVIAPPPARFGMDEQCPQIYHSMRSMFHDITRLLPPIPKKVNTMMSLRCFFFVAYPNRKKTSSIIIIVFFIAQIE
jgi:hypothetical protein